MKRLALVLLLAATSIAYSQTRAAEALAKYCKQHRIVGCSIAISKGDKIILRQGIGLADVENDVPAAGNSVYRLASISKTITAVAVMQLVEQGKIALDHDAREYAPEFPKKEYVFTIRQLLCHQSGIRHYKLGEGESKQSYKSVADSFARFQSDPLLHRPGDKSTYSTYAYQLLARAIETASGMTYPQYLRKHLFNPAGMTASGTEDLSAIVPHRVRGYRHAKDGTLLNGDYTDLSYKWGGGGLVSTAPDLCRFAIAIMDGKLLKPQTVKLMWTKQRLNSGKETANGLGWVIGKRNGRPVMQHAGSQTGTATYLMIFPQDHVVIAVLSNDQSAKIAEIAGVAATTYFGGR